MYLGLREIWVMRRSMSCILQGILSNQPCTLLSFLHKRIKELNESVSGWLCNSDSLHLNKRLVENRPKK